MFRKFAVVTITAVVCFLTVGCYSLKMAGPSDVDVKLRPSTKPTSFKTKVKGWYLLGGLIPLGNAGSGVSRAIKENNLTEVRLETKLTFVDYLITGLLFAIVSPNTTVIEGNVGGGSSSGSFSALSQSVGSDESLPEE